MAAKKKKGSESFWPRFQRRIKHDRKSKTYSVEISPTAGESKALVRILSVSTKVDVIPVTIVSPIDKAAEIISVKSQKSEENEEVISKPARRSWVRVVVRTFGFSTSRNGKVRQVPANDGAETVRVEPPKILNTSSPDESTPRPALQQLLEATDSKPPVSEKPKGINFQGKMKPHASAPCSPLKSLRATAPAASASYTHLPPTNTTFSINKSAVTYKASTKSAVADRASTKTVVDLEFTEGYDAAIGVSVLIVVMLCLVFSDKLVAVVCTSIWWYAVAMLKTMVKSNKTPTTSSKPFRREKQLIKSLSNSNIDLHSSEYKKKVIMEGILHRNVNAKR